MQPQPPPDDPAADRKATALVGADEVDGAEILWRRIGPDWIVERDGADGVSSAAFLDNVDGNVSVHLASLTTIEAIRGAYQHCRIAALPASIPQSLGFTVQRDPLPEDPSHALLIPPKTSRSKNTKRADARKMAVSCEFVD